MHVLRKNNHLVAILISFVGLISSLNKLYGAEAVNATNITAHESLRRVCSVGIRYGTYFAAGAVSQTAINQSVGAIKTRWDLPALTQNQTAILTGTGSVYAMLPLMLTLTAVANLGLPTVTETMKGEIEGTTKEKVTEKFDNKYAETIPDPQKKEETKIKSWYDRQKTNVSGRQAATAVAHGSLLARSLVVSATIASMVGPKVIEYVWPDRAAESVTQVPEPQLQLTPEQETLQILKELQKKSNASPLATIINISPEQMSFFAGQLAACVAPNTLAIRYWKQIKKYMHAWRAK